jgi:hypothetical protein
MSYRYFDVIALQLMLVLAIFSGYQLFFSQYQNNIRENAEFIAVIDNQDNTVKKKNFNFLSWLDATPGDELANNDLVYTHEQSSADVKFDDGFEVSLAENTLFRVQRQKEVQTIIVRKGIMHTRLTSRNNHIKFKLAGKDFDIKSQDAQIQILKGADSSRITVLKGTATITADNEVTVLKENEFLEYKEKTKTKEVKQIPFRLIAPKSNNKIYYTGEKVLTFKWKTPEASSRIQISKNKEFSQLVMNEEVSGQDTQANLVEGYYYWRVSNSQGESEIRTFQLILDNAPKILTPKNRQRLSFPEGSTNKKIIVNWEKQKVDGYTLEVQYKKEKKTFNTKRTSHILENAKEGIYKNQSSSQR